MMLSGMGDFSNEAALARLGLFSLERKRLRGDLLEVYKILNGMDRVESMRLFPRVEGSVTRGHRFKVRGGNLKEMWEANSSHKGLVSAWNVLSEEVVEADTIAAFKKYLDEYMNRKGTEGYGS
eukprot:g21280.t1